MWAKQIYSWSQRKHHLPINKNIEEYFKNIIRIVVLLNCFFLTIIRPFLYTIIMFYYIAWCISYSYLQHEPYKISSWKLYFLTLSLSIVNWKFSQESEISSLPPTGATANDSNFLDHWFYLNISLPSWVIILAKTLSKVLLVNLQ